MMIATYTESLKTRGQNDCLDITQTVQKATDRSKIREGLLTVFVTGSTAGVTTIEFEPGYRQLQL